MSEYKATIGLEVHAELKTRTKMFCDSINDPEEKTPNVNICPVCMAHPGTLPVINKEAVKHVLKVGLSVGGTLADFTEFDRKNYFYPDIPKGYQISQYKYPLISGGTLNGVKLTRIHLEEDTARSSHDKGEYSLVDFNRAGIPLMELVTEPVVKSAEEASAFARELQLLLRTLGASDANMEKGEMRVEANISVSTTEKFGTKVEVKNLNSFRTVERAIAYEIDRQSKALDRGEKVIQETRGWDEGKQITFSQRLKEESHDYRYFPDPDLPKLKISEIEELSETNLRKELPELPWEKRERLTREFGVKQSSAEIFVQNEQLGALFEVVAKKIGDKKGSILAENYITSDLAGLMKESGALGNVIADNFSALMQMILENKISSRGAKEILLVMYQDGGAPEVIAESQGLLQKSDTGELTEIVKKILDENKNIVAEYKQGKTASLQFLIGQVMKVTKGSANPQIAKEVLIKLLK
ncbi:MAG: Asp-tRNA(Asn)/Glu-tRNA(Gln) amidotransferase subunit GatB [Candidatus Yonathbacteria bacterium]|nr:Asp-tRNA(Asn)/Glu-tRNA(Gln) amidotransferase subunit GatB [Candidatus Yonathbacteria bacterium]